MIRLLQRKLIIPRGDTGSFTIPAIAAASASDVAVFTIFDRLTRTKAFQKRIAVDGAQLKVEFNHNETVNLVPGHYVWDIKFYKNPIYADEELINGEEIDSYYAGYSLPECEIRETGDDLLISPDAAQGELTPEQLDIITAAITEASNAKIEAQNKAAEAATSADEADASARSAAEQAENAAQSATEAAASANSAAASKNDALASATAAAQSATIAGNKAQEAEQSAIRAENAANAAEGSADAAEDSATNAAGSAADATTAKNSAQMSADDASQSAIAARQSAEASARSANEANISKEQAQTAATNAAESESNASISANTASSKAGEAYMNSLTAERSAVSATASKNAAAQSEAAANTSRNEAQAAATSAAASAAQAQEYAGQLTGLTTEAQTLPAGASATASYDAETGVLTLGLPQGDSFHIVKTYASVAEMNADYNNSNIKIGDFVMITSTVEDPDNAKIYVKGNEAYTFVVDMSGASGIEGVSIAGIQKTSTSGLVDTYTITYTNDTTTTFTVTNGEDGDEYTVLVQANQPTQNTNKLWIPTNQGVVREVPTVQEMNEAIAAIDVPVQDVQVNGTSVVQDGVANVPLASTSTIGVIKTKASSDSGLKMVTDSLVIDCAGASAIKAGTNSYMPIVPEKQDQSTFYGLAKAAGDTTQSQSSNFVGIYTDEAKAAINNMLGSATKEELAAIDYAPAIHATTSNNTFTDGVEGRPAACTIELKPTQAGSGTPSASNIRTITGYQEVYLWRGNGENHTALSTDPFTGGIGATAAKFVALSPFQSLEAYRISRAELVADKHYRLEFNLEISGTTETNRPRVYIGNTMPTSGTSSIATKINENNGHYIIDFNTNTQQLYSGDVFSFSPISFRNDVQNVQFTISNLTLIETDSWYFNIPEEAQDVYGESMSMDENLHLITVEKKAFFGGVFTIDTDGNTVLTKTHKCIRSYNGETLPGVWISDRDEYASGTTPTTGALVVYELAEADRETYVIQKHYVTSLAGVNVFTSDVGTVSIDGYIADTKLYIDNATAGGIQDVQVNGQSVVTDGVANIPMASGSTSGVVIIDTSNQTGIQIRNNKLMLRPAVLNDIKASWGEAKPLTPPLQDASAFYGLAKAAGDTTQSASSNAVGSYTENAKSKISEMLNAPVSVSGTTPTITALSGIQYVCGEVLTLDIALPASGIVDVVFESGSTPTVLTITPPTGVTVKWANGFDPTALDANTTYELNIKDGLGVAVRWT